MPEAASVRGGFPLEIPARAVRTHDCFALGLFGGEDSCTEAVSPPAAGPSRWAVGFNQHLVARVGRGRRT
jgi:hypothetical protein